MKSRILYLISLLIIIFIASCTKHNQSSDGSICITRITPKVSDYKVAGANLDSIKTLFAANNLSTSNLQFQSFGTDTVINILPGNYSGYQEQISATQFFNGLPVFSGDAYFIFDAGIFQTSESYFYNGVLPDADTTSHQSYINLRNAFLAHVSESSTIGGPVNSKPFIPSASTYINACLDVTLGYIDASRITGSNVAYGKQLIKVWSVTPSINSAINYYPLVYVEDNNGLAWGNAFVIP